MASTITTSVTTGGTNSHATSSAEVNATATDFIHAGVAGPITLNSGSGGTGSFCVNADGTPDMGITVKAGSAWITATPSGQTSQKLRAYMASDYTAYTISANASGSTKYDWIYLSVDATKANNPASDASDVTSLYTSRSSSNSTDNGTPPTYGLLLAVVTVANGASSITNSNISDKRTTATFRSSPAASGVNSLDVTTATTGNPPTITAQGSDTNIDLKLLAKGTGVINLNGNQLKITTGSNGGSAGGTANYIKIGPLAICWGITSSISLSAASQATGTVTFPITYSSAPAMTVGGTPSSTVDLQAHLNTTPSTTGVTIAVDSTTGTQTGSMLVHWVAIGVA